MRGGLSQSAGHRLGTVPKDMPCGFIAVWSRPRIAPRNVQISVLSSSGVQVAG